MDVLHEWLFICGCVFHMNEASYVIQYGLSGFLFSYIASTVVFNPVWWCQYSIIMLSIGDDSLVYIIHGLIAKHKCISFLMHSMDSLHNYQEDEGQFGDAYTPVYCSQLQGTFIWNHLLGLFWSYVLCWISLFTLFEVCKMLVVIIIKDCKSPGLI